jgi:hypothetical protein
VLTLALALIVAVLSRAGSFTDLLDRAWPFMLGLAYLPALVMVLRRPSDRA